MDPSTDGGALISAEHRDKVLGYVSAGVAGGAQVLCGGGVPSGASFEGDGPLAGGYFVEPTVFVGCDDGMAIVTDEIFGPVMSVLTFTDEAEVIRRANDTPYGLAAGVFTSDLSRAHRMAAALQAGIVWINNYNLTPIEVPFGGVKQSGIGRENSLTTINHYTQLKTVYVEMGDVEAPY